MNEYARLRIIPEEVFIECPPKNWAVLHEAWKLDHSCPCPMPIGHMMFDNTLQTIRVDWKEVLSKVERVIAGEKVDMTFDLRSPDERVPKLYGVIKRLHQAAIDGKYTLDGTEASKHTCKIVAIVLKEVLAWMEAAFAKEELEGKDAEN